MHPDVVSEEPASCPRCGMKLLPQAAPSGPYTCPMHPEVVSDEPSHCPECGMKLLPASLISEGSGQHEHGDVGHSHEDHGHDHDHSHAAAGGIEWEDDMVDVNRMTTPANMRWKIVDRETGAENAAIAWQFRVGDQVKVRLLNEMAGDHPMHHPFHVHGAGRFLVLSRDGVPESNLCGRTRCWCGPAKRSTSSSMSRTPASDGPLPHRRAPRERNDVHVRGGRVMKVAFGVTR